MEANVTSMAATDRLALVLTKAKEKYLDKEVGTMIDQLLSPTNLAIMVATLVLWAGSHLVGIGEIVDILLLIVGAFTIGWSIKDVAEDIYTFADLTINARTDADLDKAAQAFSHAIVLAGVTVIMALLLRRSVKQIQATRGVNVLEAMKPRYKPGLARLTVNDPEPGSLWSKPKFVADPKLPPNQGKTLAFGEVRISTGGTASQLRIALFHELVHRFLKPRFILFRTFRVRLAASGYLRSALLKYLEEALAETYGQLRVNGIRGLIAGIKFPVDNGYISVSSILSEGAAIGTISLGTQYFLVQFVPDGKEPDLVCYVDEAVCR